MTRALCTDPLPEALVEICRSLLPDNVPCAAVPTLALDDFARMAADAEFLLVGHRPVDDALLAMAPNVRLVQRLGLGHENIDAGAVVRAGVPAAHTPGANAGVVAEHTIMLMLVLVKRFLEAEAAARAGGWPMMKMAAEGIGDLEQATIGLIGLGYIGQAVAELLLPFQADVRYHTRHRVDASLEERLGVTYLPLDELLETSHIVSLHVPATDETHHMMGDEQFARMPAGSYLINTSRGTLVDEDALRRAVESGHLAGAGLDAVQNETAGGNLFTELPQIVVTPHTAGPTVRGVQAILEQAIANVVRVLNGEPVMDPIPGTDGAGG